TFLKDTSLLDQMVPSFCDAFLETSNAAILLENAQRQGLFVICTGESEEPVYRCHPILRELFQEELRRHEGERYRILHKRIATLFYQKHEYQVALDHALEAQEYDLATNILLEAAPTLFNQGHSETVLRSLDRFPSQLAEKNPQLLLLQVNTYLRRGDFANARLFFDIAQDLGMASPPTNENTNDTPLCAEFVIAHGKLLLYQGEYQLAQQRFRQALEWLLVDERVLRIYAHQHLGICIILGGDPVSEGIVQFQQALQLCH